MNLEDVANQLLLPILGDVDPSVMELSLKEEAREAKLKKEMSGNAKLPHWVGAFSKASDVVCRVAFVAFWLCKFIFGSHPHYALKPLYFLLAIKISVGMSLPLAPMVLGCEFLDPLKYNWINLINLPSDNLVQILDLG